MIQYYWKEVKGCCRKLKKIDNVWRNLYWNVGKCKVMLLEGESKQTIELAKLLLCRGNSLSDLLPTMQYLITGKSTVFSLSRIHDFFLEKTDAWMPGTQSETQSVRFSKRSQLNSLSWGTWSEKSVCWRFESTQKVSWETDYFLELLHFVIFSLSYLQYNPFIKLPLIVNTFSLLQSTVAITMNN